MQDWSKDQIMLSFKIAGLLEGRLVLRISNGCAERNQSAKDITKSENLPQEISIAVKGNVPSGKAAATPRPVPFRQQGRDTCTPRKRVKTAGIERRKVMEWCLRLKDECITGGRSSERSKLVRCAVRRRGHAIRESHCVTNAHLRVSELCL